MIAKTRGDTVDDAVIVPEAMVAATLGDGARRGEKKPPGTRSKAVAMLRQELIDAQAYATKRAADDPEKQPARDLRKEALAAVLAGDVPLLVTAHRHQDILAALRLADEFGFRLVLDGCADAPLVLDEIAAAGVPVIAHPPQMRTGGADSETANASFETPRLLLQRGIPFALQTGFEDYVPKVRVLLFEAGVAVHFGLDREAALASITRDAAAILGIDDRVGSLEVGKDGDVALYDGDPFEYTSHCIGVIIEGEVVSDVVR
jgi:imidazolonepropionase-like amidohydrolase